MARPRRRAPEEPVSSEVDRGPQADPESVARTIVLTKLTARARSRRELTDALADRGVPSEVAERVLDRFASVGLVDDAAFARSWVQSRQSSRALSRRALAVELGRKGIDGDIVQDSLAGIDDDAEYDAARRLVARKLPSVRNRDPNARWRQLVGLLARRGYPSGLAVRVVIDVLRDDASTDSGLETGEF